MATQPLPRVTAALYGASCSTRLQHLASGAGTMPAPLVTMPKQSPTYHGASWHGTCYMQKPCQPVFYEPAHFGMVHASAKTMPKPTACCIQGKVPQVVIFPNNASQFFKKEVKQLFGFSRPRHRVRVVPGVRFGYLALCCMFFVILALLYWQLFELAGVTMHFQQLARLLADMVAGLTTHCSGLHPA